MMFQQGTLNWHLIDFSPVETPQVRQEMPFVGFRYPGMVPRDRLIRENDVIIFTPPNTYWAFK